MVLGRHLDEPEVDVLDRVVRAVVAEAQPGRLGAGGTRHDLVPEADPEQRPAVLDHGPRERDGAFESRRITRPRRQDDPVDVRRERDRGRDRVGQDAHPGATPPHALDDVRLEAVVDDRDERTAVLRPADVRDRPRRDLPDEVLVLPARNGARSLRSSRLGELARRHEDPAQRPGGPEMAGQRPRVDAGDRRNAVGAQEGCQLPRIVEDRGRGIGHDEPPEPRLHRLVVVDQAAVVADQRVGHDHDLARVRRVGTDLLVAGLARVHHEIAARRDGRPECDAAEDRAVLERQQCRTQVTDPWIDDGGGSDMRRRDHEGARTPGRGFEENGEAVDVNGAAARSADDPEHGRSASFPASRDRYAGLTGPAEKERRQRSTGAGLIAARGPGYESAEADTNASNPGNSSSSAGDPTRPSRRATAAA